MKTPEGFLQENGFVMAADMGRQSMIAAFLSSIASSSALSVSSISLSASAVSVAISAALVSRSSIPSVIISSLVICCLLT